MNLFYQPEISNGTLHLDSEESRHAVKVFRYKNGDEINVTDGLGSFYTATLVDANSKKCSFKIIDKVNSTTNSFYIHIAIAPTKNIDRLEWFIEKAIEIGVDEISLIICSNSERKIVKTERLQKKAISAMKQSLKSTLPKINEQQSFKNFVKGVQHIEKYIAYVDFKNSDLLKNIALANSNYCLCIGPEGDFSTEELQLAINADFKKVSLGNSRLRTETAGIVGCNILNLINE